MPERHFPEPCEELDACFVVKDLNGQALAYMYFEKEPRHRHRRSELLTRDEARRIAAIFCQAAGVAKAVMTNRPWGAATARLALLPNWRTRNLSPCSNHFAITLRYAGRAAYHRSDRRDPLRLGEARASGSAKAA